MTTNPKIEEAERRVIDAAKARRELHREYVACEKCSPQFFCDLHTKKDMLTHEELNQAVDALLSAEAKPQQTRSEE